MRRLLFGLVLVFTLSITLGGFAVNTSVAHAASRAIQSSPLNLGPKWESIETKTFPASQEECAAIIKANPKLASNPQGCNITLVSKTSILQTSQMAPDGCCGCPSGTKSHSFTKEGPLGAYGTELDTTFHWDGWCNVITVDYQNCYRNNWADYPFSLSVTYCSNFMSGIDRIAEDDVYVCAFGVNCASGWIRSSADAYSYTITDTISS